MTTPSARSTSDRRRDWQGPALFLLGFRPFFLMAGLWAVLAMVLWIAMLTGRVEVPTRFDPIAWHAHEFLFGYGSAVVAEDGHVVGRRGILGQTQIAPPRVDDGTVRDAFAVFERRIVDVGLDEHLAQG